MAKSLRRRLRQIDRTKILSAEERIKHILNARTERLATRSDAQAAPAANAPRVLVCGAGRERFGIPVEAIQEILPSKECMPIPDGPPALVGVFGRGGRLVSVIDLAAALGIEAVPSDNENQHFVLLRHEPSQVALRVERAYAVTDITPLAGDETGGARTDAVAGYAKAQTGLADQDAVLSLLDINRLLRPFLPSSPVPGV